MHSRHHHREHDDGDAIVAHEAVKEVQHLVRNRRDHAPDRPAEIHQFAQRRVVGAILGQERRLLGADKELIFVRQRLCPARG